MIALDDLLLVRLAGIVAIVGAALYVVGDVLLLAVKPDRAAHPVAASHAAALGDLEKLASIDPGRVVPGGLLGVLATPLVLAGWWLLGVALAPAGGLAVGPAVLFGVASVIGGFAHGWFMALAGDARDLDRLGADPAVAPALLETLARDRRILAVAFTPMLLAAVLASAWQALVVLGDMTALPTWFAAVNPVVILALFLGVRRILPVRARDALEGTGFSVANLVVFVVLLAVLWGGISGLGG